MSQLKNLSDMAYELHIEKRDGAIRMEDWKSAITEIDGVRLCSSSGHSVTNPESGETISFPFSGGDAEVYSPTDKTWQTSFYWSKGKISFRAMLLPGDVSNCVWQAATLLASRLDAIIRGDEGETYDLKTGKVLE